MSEVKSNLIGLGLAILGMILSTITQFPLFYIVFFIGIFLFASLPSEDIFVDYIIANSNQVLMRKRHYLNFLPLTIVSGILTLGKATLMIVWKDDYFKATKDSQNQLSLTQVSLKEYIALRNEQRKIYSTQLLSKEFMKTSYTVETIGLKRKRRRLIIAGFFACLMLTMIFEPGGIYLTLIYEAIFIPMILLWIPEYKDAKIIQKAYDRALGNN